MARRAQGMNIDEDAIRWLEKRAMKGDDTAYRELLNMNAKYAKRANTRLSALEDKHMDFYAYDRAFGYTATTYNKNRFTTSKKLLEDAHGVSQNLREIRRFLNSESSTIGGQKKIQRKRVEAFKQQGFEIPKGKETDFLRFLGSESVQGIIEVIGHSEKIVDAISGQLKQGRSIDSLQRDFDYYLSGNIKYDELMDRIGGEV